MEKFAGVTKNSEMEEVPDRVEDKSRQTELASGADAHSEGGTPREIFAVGYTPSGPISPGRPPAR